MDDAEARSCSEDGGRQNPKLVKVVAQRGRHQHRWGMDRRVNADDTAKKVTDQLRDQVLLRDSHALLMPSHAHDSHQWQRYPVDELSGRH
jgi:hypothetical protein